MTHTESDSRPVRIAAIVGAAGVGLGAFGAHGLEGLTGITPERIEWWNTGARYHLIHAVGLLAVTLARPNARWTRRLWLAGIAIFGATLYAMALGAPRWFGAITPIGGVCLILGWLSLWGHARRE